MSNKSNENGRAFEYGFLITLEKEIAKLRAVQIKNNKAIESAKKCWESIEESLKEKLILSSQAVINALFEVEPNITEADTEPLLLQLQSDKKGGSWRCSRYNSYKKF